MDLVVVEDYEEMSRTAARCVAEVIREKPEASVIAATGGTPMGTYRELARTCAHTALDTSAMHALQLDEYVGISDADRRSLFRWMKRALLDPLAIPPERTVRLRGDVPDLEGSCAEYDQAVQRVGGPDLAILGLGPNAHLGFNEPPSHAASPTRVVELTPRSIQSNASYWGAEEDVPRRAVTAGMTVLLATRRVLLVVSGEHKRDILGRTLYGPITPHVPASFLQRHRNCTVIADRAAAGVKRG